METQLTLSMGGFPPLSARGCTQTLTSPPAHFVRTIEGQLICLGPKIKKYVSVIEGSDVNVLSTDNLMIPGTELEVGCIQHLWQRVKGGPFTLSRTPIADSLCFMGQVLDAYEAPEEGFVSYRPLLKMALKSYTLSTDEWGLKTKWRMELEEV